MKNLLDILPLLKSKRMLGHFAQILQSLSWTDYSRVVVLRPISYNVEVVKGAPRLLAPRLRYKSGSLLQGPRRCNQVET